MLNTRLLFALCKLVRFSSALFALAACASTPQPITTQPTAVITAVTPRPAPTSTTPPVTIAAPTATAAPCPPFAYETRLPDPDVPENYSGHHFDPQAMPAGLTHQGGFLIEGPINHALVVVQRADGSEMYWLERIVCLDTRGKAYYEVRAVLPLPDLIGNQTMADVCSIDGNEDWTIIAAGVYQPDQPPRPYRDTYGWPLSNIDFAWRVDVAAEKFVPVVPDDLTCMKVVDWSFRPTVTPSK